ncbi:MarR family winged helix-turn-helix transcriptional regulator [Mycobacterium sp.]|uniref:MarR family winged helix-turn-helix transcriptional regulator n=1 Tax=Mycobacterium sp. TaxID=1785 RepID=UPI003D11E2FD
MSVADELITLSAGDGEAWGGLLRIHKLIMTVMSQELEHQHGLPLTSYDVLRHIALADGQRLRMSELAERVMITRSGLTGVVGRLEAAGLLQRESAANIDGRGAFAAITAEGWKILRRANKTITASIHSQFLDQLTEQDLADLRRVWRKLGTIQGQLPRNVSTRG